MPSRKLAAAAALLLLVPLGAAQAANLSPIKPILIDVPPAVELHVPEGVGLVDPGVYRPVEIDGARDEARIELHERDDGDERPGLQTRQFETQVALSCKISGGDLIIVNTGLDAIAAGTTIKWQLKGGGQKGYLAMKSDVAPGKGFKARNVLEGAGDGDRCSARGV